MKAFAIAIFLCLCTLCAGIPVLCESSPHFYLETGDATLQFKGDTRECPVGNRDDQFQECSTAANRLIFYPSQDSYVDQETPFTNTHVYAAYFFLRVRSLSAKNQRALVQFYTGSSIPYGSFITDAELRVWLNFAPLESRIFDLHRILENWHDTTVTWENHPIFREDITAMVETGDERKWLEWDVTEDVQGYVRGSIENYGWLFKDRDEDTPYPGFFTTLRSLESPLIEYFPRLVIYYEEDEDPPLVTIESLQEGGVYYSPAVSLAGTVRDNVGVSQVEFWHQWQSGSTGGRLSIDPSTAVHDFEWPLTLRDGINTIMVNGTDMVGNRVSESVTFTHIPDAASPEVMILSPEDGCLYIGGRRIVRGLFGQTVIIGKMTFMADAVDYESGIDRVEFYIDTELRYVDASDPFEWILDEPLFGKHSVGVTGYDMAGNMDHDSIEFIILNP